MSVEMPSQVSGMMAVWAELQQLPKSVRESMEKRLGLHGRFIAEGIKNALAVNIDALMQCGSSSAH